jgi:hypothetical protein
MDDLTQAQHKAAAALYQQAAPGQPGEGAGDTHGDGGSTSGSQAGGRGKDDVIDAEVVDDK